MLVAKRFSSLLAMTALVGVALGGSPAHATDDYPGVVAQQEGATRLEPSTPWNLDFGEDKCRLTRLFGSEEDRHLVFIEQSAPGRPFGLTLAGSSLNRFVSANRLDLGMQEDMEMQRLPRFNAGEVAGIGPAVILSSVSLEKTSVASVQSLNSGAQETPSGDQARLSTVGVDIEEAAKIDRIVLRRGSRALSFETGNLGPIMEALNTCTFDLLNEWGLNPEQHRSYTAPRWTNQLSIVRRIMATYPRRAIIRGEQAIFRMRVIVEADGSVSECVIAAATETERLDSPACREMMEARFEPALDSEGNPMRSFYATSITYAID